MTGDKPVSRRAQTLTVLGDHAYVLLLNDEKLYIYQLDLQTWHWRRLPQRPIPFSMTDEDTMVTALIQVQDSLVPLAAVVDCPSACPCSAVLRVQCFTGH